MMKDLRREFPILKQKINGEALIYFDNAATSQKPLAVIEALTHFYSHDNANIHRGVHTLAQRATEAYEASRQAVQQFINAEASSEIIFTSGTTASINFLAYSLGRPRLQAGDYILLSPLEHHSNVVPWQEIAQISGAHLHYVGLDEDFQLDLETVPAEVIQKTQVIAIQHVSNILGVVQDIQAISQWRDQVCPQAVLVVDGAQSVAHMAVDVEALGVDAYSFSSHKMYGPSGLGVCYLKEKHHAQTPPFLFGGEMIHQVQDHTSNYKEAPWKYEAGTPPIAQAVGLKAAIEWLAAIGWPAIEAWEGTLSQRLIEGLRAIEGVEVYGPADFSQYLGIVSFNIDGLHPHDAATAYDTLGIAVRAGHHCSQPLMRYLKTHATLRASLAIYNSPAEVDAFIRATQEIKEFFG